MQGAMNTGVLLQNYPNPFNPTTTIEYTIKNRGWVTLSIYNVIGEHVTKLTDRLHAPGNYSVIWNGTDTDGNKAKSGIYFCRIRADGLEACRKLSLVK
ncbi:T9SS type A sorting domain-containing protein [candidate division KSB1 bacterium]|nr:T9SS type A sorting domain-containing protein [candidate division KSB1 bacterium]